MFIITIDNPMSANRSVLGTRGLTSIVFISPRVKPHHHFLTHHSTRVALDSGSRAGSPDPVSYHFRGAALPAALRGFPCAAGRCRRLCPPAPPAPLLPPAAAGAPLPRRPPAGDPLPDWGSRAAAEGHPRHREKNERTTGPSSTRSTGAWPTGGGTPIQAVMHHRPFGGKEKEAGQEDRASDQDAVSPSLAGSSPRVTPPVRFLPTGNRHWS